MKKRRGVYIDPLWVAFLMVGVAIGLLIAFARPAQAAEKEVVPVVTTHYIEVPAEPIVQTVAAEKTTEAAEAEPVLMPKAEAGARQGDLELLALVIYQEAGGDMCSDETRQMVGEVVLNRVASKRYPNTIEGVITQQAQYGRLHWTGPVWPERAKNPGEQHAVERAYRIAEELLIDKVDRLLPEDVVYQAEFKQGAEVVAEAPPASTSADKEVRPWIHGERTMTSA